ncbi:MAG TPA: LamB/YcsF family protein [Thermoanaerobaculia bacterium]|nr:LamB/YcsF family protein [Thermoanaerobaculia bacterium]
MIELSADLGEAATDEERAVEREIWALIDAANVACGGHAGDEESMREAALAASRLGVVLGAHPSYPDRENFGRKSMVIDGASLSESLGQQIERLRTIAERERVKLERVKPHGALYSDAHRDRTLAELIVGAMRRVDPALAIVASDTSEMAAAARDAGTPVIREAFADRGYRADGSLVPRSEPGALLSIEEAANQAGRLVRGEMAIAFDTLCIHADMERSVDRLKAIRKRLMNPDSSLRSE